MSEVTGYLRIERYFENDKEKVFVEIFNSEENWESEKSIDILYSRVCQLYKEQPIFNKYQVSYLQFKVQYSDRNTINRVLLVSGITKDVVDSFVTNLYKNRKQKLDIQNKKMIDYNSINNNYKTN